MRSFSFLLKYIKQLASSGVRESHDTESRRKIFLINIFVLSGISCLICLGSLALYQDANILAFADLTIAGILSCLLLYLRLSGNQVFCSYATAIVINIFFCFLFGTGGVSGTAFMWLYTYPIVALFLLGLLHGSLATIFLLFFTTLILTVNLLSQSTNLYDLSFAVRFIPSFLVIFGLTYINEKSRADSQEKLVQKQEALTQAIIRLTTKETQLKQAQDKLEQRVVERTQELVAANTHLQEEIEDRKKAENERNHLQNALSRAQKMEVLGRLAGGVAHDLNNVLSGIVSYPDFLLLDLPTESPLRIPLQTIKKSGERAAAIVQDLLTLARRGVTVRKPLSLNKILKEYFASPEYSQLCKHHPEITVNTSFDDNIPRVNGSPVHLQKAIMNLIGNAFEAVEGDGHINISTQTIILKTPFQGYEVIEQGQYTVLEIEDSGTGMTNEVIGKIFEPFYTKKKMGRSGTGLGMTVVWGAIKDHDGFIDICSDPGKGTKITTYFPVIDDESACRRDVNAATPVVNAGKGQTILIVDDVAEQRDIGISIMKKLGYQALAVSSGEEAVKLVAQQSFDLILLDMIMATGMDGLDTYREIIAIAPQQKIIIVSGYSENDRVREALALGQGTYLKKPYTIEEVSQIVASELA